MLKLLRSTIRIICRNTSLSLIQVPKATFLCLLNFRSKYTHYVIICDHIGDFLITMGYLAEYKKEKGKKHITVCTTSNLTNLLTLYQNSFDDYIEVPSKRLYELLALAATNFGTHILGKLKNITLINPADAFVEDSFQYIMRYPHVRLKDCIQYGCLQLQPTATFITPQSSKYGTMAKVEGVERKRTVLLCPYARAAVLDEIGIFTSLSKTLKKLGFMVLTNISDSSQEPVKGTKGVSCTLADVFSLVETGGYVVGARSGLLDLLVYAECKMVAIYPEENKYLEFFNLSQMPQIKADVLQLKVSEDVQRDIETIISFLIGGDGSCR